MARAIGHNASDPALWLIGYTMFVEFGVADEFKATVGDDASVYPVLERFDRCRPILGVGTVQDRGCERGVRDALADTADSCAMFEGMPPSDSVPDETREADAQRE